MYIVHECEQIESDRNEDIVLEIGSEKSESLTTNTSVGIRSSTECKTEYLIFHKVIW